MKFRIISIFISIPLIFLFMFGCKKTTEKRLDGSWIVQNVANITNPDYEEWVFGPGDNLTIRMVLHVDTNVFSYTYIGKFKLKSTSKLVVSDFNMGLVQNYNREWEIAKLNKKTLMLVYGKNGLEFKEFYKN